jgi:putative transcriptional regulator
VTPAPAPSEHRIEIHLDKILLARGMTQAELSERTGITPANISKLKNRKVTAVWFSTLTALCDALDCQPGDILTCLPAGEPTTD